MRPRFNFMWFWAFVLISIIGYSMFGEQKARPIEGDWAMINDLIELGYVERINVLDKEKATVFLTEEAMKAVAEDERFANIPTTGAQITFNTGGDIQYFASCLNSSANIMRCFRQR